ncbi:hypothetical protein Pint_04099 [Pistacia integerrima]|uniref:Uncharacterized protein n=1 Tax=Pistacia integerrima TaxID=434235 RepID=A0ACC0Z9I7_9ROSI|nr:hypothetical protein Pint_04099 [Pistacia integerrima]
MAISLTCIHGYPSLDSVNSHLNHKHKMLHTNNNEPLRLSSSEKPTRLTRKFPSLRAFAVTDSYYTLVLAATSPPKSGDISVFLQTSAVMLLVYLIANFLVPSIISKSLELDEEKEDSSPKV